MESCVEEDFRLCPDSLRVPCLLLKSLDGQWCCGEREMGNRKWWIDTSSCHSWPDLDHVFRLSQEIVPYKWWKLCANEVCYLLLTLSIYKHLIQEINENIEL